MRAFAILSAFCCFLHSFVAAAAIANDGLMIASHRDTADASLLKLRKRQSGAFGSSLGKSLYWFGNFTVGDSGSLKLLLDTGSSDLIINPGL